MRFKGILSLLSRRTWGALADSGALERAQHSWTFCRCCIETKIATALQGCPGNISVLEIRPSPRLLLLLLFCK